MAQSLVRRDNGAAHASGTDDVTADRIAATDRVDFGPAADLAGFMARMAQVQIYEAFYRDFHDRKITPGQIGILIAVGRNPGIRQGALAEALRIKRSNMAKVVQVLERGGMLEKRTGARDQRATELRLTRKGRTLVERMVPEVAERDRVATAMLSDQERATLLRFLARIVGYPGRES